MYLQVSESVIGTQSLYMILRVCAQHSLSIYGAKSADLSIYMQYSIFIYGTQCVCVCVCDTQSLYTILSVYIYSTQYPYRVLGLIYNLKWFFSASCLLSNSQSIRRYIIRAPAYLFMFRTFPSDIILKETQ